MNKNAFSLIEVMIILVIASIGVLAMIPIMTGKTDFTSRWEEQSFIDAAGQRRQYICYGRDGDSTDRVGIMADPYNTNTQGRLAVNAMGVAGINAAAVQNYNKFIFGGIDGVECNNPVVGGAAPAKFFADGEICPAAAANNHIDTVWSDANINNALIIGRNYGAGNANVLAHNDSTIISSFVAAPNNTINGICIGNVTANNCTAPNQYSLNDVVRINNTTNTTEFFEIGGANPVITVNNNGVETHSANGININGDLYALLYPDYDYQPVVQFANCPVVFKANVPNPQDDSGDIDYDYIAAGTAQKSVTPTFIYTCYNNPAAPNPANGDLNIIWNNGGSLPVPGENGVPEDAVISYDAPQPEPGGNPDPGIDSDIRLKNVLKPYEKGLEYISKIKTHYYTFKNDVEKKLHAGIIAQEIIGIFDEALEKTKDGFYSYKKSPFLYAMVNSVKSLYSEQQDILKEQEKLLRIISKK